MAHLSPRRHVLLAPSPTLHDTKPSSIPQGQGFSVSTQEVPTVFELRTRTSSHLYGLTPLGHCLSTKALLVPLAFVKASLIAHKIFVCSWILKRVMSEILFKVYKHVWLYTLLFDLPHNEELLKGRSWRFVFHSFLLYVSHQAWERRAGSTLHSSLSCALDEFSI